MSRESHYRAKPAKGKTGAGRTSRLSAASGFRRWHGRLAGDHEYLENFLFPRVIVENVMRRGFTPPEE